jgi:hypothetical protein
MEKDKGQFILNYNIYEYHTVCIYNIILINMYLYICLRD